MKMELMHPLAKKDPTPEPSVTQPCLVSLERAHTRTEQHCLYFLVSGIVCNGIAAVEQRRSLIKHSGVKAEKCQLCSLIKSICLIHAMSYLFP